jgi:hypothetical protein
MARTASGMQRVLDQLDQLVELRVEATSSKMTLQVGWPSSEGGWNLLCIQLRRPAAAAAAFICRNCSER